MATTTIIDTREIKVTISSGGVHSGPDGKKVTKRDLIETADRALYMSKKNGRNKVSILPLNPKT